jgi:nucleotide-binding universal stress UspA family protein
VTPWPLGRDATGIRGDAKAHVTARKAASDWLLRQRGLSATLLSPGGDPARMIERVAEAHQCDTMVIGTHDLGQVGRLMERSVSERVPAHAEAAVVVAG